MNAAANTSVRRRLAAVLIADVVGYSMLMAQDEEATFSRVMHLMRELVDPTVKAHDGRIVKTTGDGIVVEFATSGDAVMSAIEVQDALALQVRSQPLSGLTMRIGISFGDIIIEPDGDIFGDEVNIAARLEQLALPGGICVSGKVHDAVDADLQRKFEYWGEQLVKNIPRPITLYMLARAADARNPEIPLPPLTDMADRLHVMVTPLAGISDVAESYFFDGFTEDLITELTRFNQLKVASFSSSLQLKNETPKALAQDLGVQFVLSGNLRRRGARIRISCELVDAALGDCIWAEHFDRDEQGIFDLQDELVGVIVATLVGRLKVAGAEKARRKPPSNLAAYECVLRGNALPLGDTQAEAEAKRWFQRAVNLDPTYGRAYAKLGHYIQLEWLRDMSESDAELDRALQIANKGLALAANDPVCLNILGWIQLHRGNFAVAEQHYIRALDLNPNDAEQIAYLGTFLTYAGEPDQALKWFERARVLDRYYDPSWYWPFQGMVQFRARRFELAIAALSHSSTMPAWVTAYLAASHALMGETLQAKLFCKKTLSTAPDFRFERFAGKEPFREQPDRDLLLQGLRASEFP